MIAWKNTYLLDQPHHRFRYCPAKGVKVGAAKHALTARSAVADSMRGEKIKLICARPAQMQRTLQCEVRREGRVKA